MQLVYLKRMTKQDITRSVAICTESVEPFWDLSLRNTTDYTPISVCHINQPNYFPSDITIHKGYGGEKDWRICGNDWKKLYADDNPSVGDIMIVQKLGYRKFSVEIAKRGTKKYDTLSLFFLGNDNYVIVGGDNSSVRINSVNYKHLSLDNPTFFPYLTALRTKPFMLLAGISGTGKSRLVRELAFKSCPKCLQDADGTTPGNYCMIEVKPNWHDSTELLGYYSRLGSGGYQFTKFVKFLVKAKMFPDVPFFVCLDEMNLAPVEQYFAEILSILETRKHPQGDNHSIKTGAIIEPRYFKELEQLKGMRHSDTGEPFTNKLTDRDIYLKLHGIDTERDIADEVGNRHDLTTEGLTLPDNVLIIGTVNMDDTTHQFSRKVIDRAMTIEMNGGRLADMYGGSGDLEYLKDENEQAKWQQAFKQRYVTADEVLEQHPEQAEKLKTDLPQRLEAINAVLKGTPFTVSYRVLNELTIMAGVMLDEQDTAADIDSIIDQAVDNILLMKILPRIEGDSEMFAIQDNTHTKLDLLMDAAPAIEKGDGRQSAKDKIQEMIDRLESQEFTRFWP